MLNYMDSLCCFSSIYSQVRFLNFSVFVVYLALCIQILNFHSSCYLFGS